MSAFGIGIGAVGLAYSIYSNEQAKKEQRKMAGAQAAEARRQASFANLQGAAEARVDAAAVAGMSGGRSGGSTLLGAMLGIENTLARDANELSLSTKNQIDQINLQSKANQTAGDVKTIATGVSVLGEIFKDNATKVDTSGTKATVSPYTYTGGISTYGFQTQQEIDAALYEGGGF